MQSGAEHGVHDARGPFAAAVRAAIAAKESDELHHLFRRRQRIQLEGTLKSLDRLAVMRDGHVVTVDLERELVDVFNPSGAHVTTIGRKGLAPGAYNLPTGVASLDDESFAVLDFVVKRVSVFRVNGDFVRSFAYSRQYFSGQQLAALSNGALLLVGASHPPQQDGGASRLVHAYDTDGLHLWSRVPFPRLPAIPWVEEYYEPVIGRSPNGILFGFPYHYSPIEVSADGDTTCLKLPSPRGFVLPTQPLDLASHSSVSPHEAYVTYQDWRATWTPVASVSATPRYIVVQYQTFDPLRYTLDVWSRPPAPRLVHRLKTNLLLMGVVDDELYYFRENVVSRGHQMTLTVEQLTVVPS